MEKSRQDNVVGWSEFEALTSASSIRRRQCEIVVVKDVVLGNKSHLFLLGRLDMLN